jgi:hypothetical protein
MSATETLTMSFFRAGTRWTPMVTPSTSIMEPRIARSPWLGPAFALCSTGSTPMEVANAASARRIYEILAERFPVYVWMPPPSPQPCVHDQTPHVQGLLRLWTGIRFAAFTHACTVRWLSDGCLKERIPICTGIAHAPASIDHSSLMSYLAQTLPARPVILNYLLSVQTEPRC